MRCCAIRLRGGRRRRTLAGMRRTVTLVAVATLAVVLGGCGGGGGGSSQRVEAADLAKQLGCAGFHADSDEMYVREGGGCSMSAGSVTIYTFDDAKGQASWLDAASTFGGLDLVGDDWVVTGDRSALTAAKATVGGAIQ